MAQSETGQQFPIPTNLSYAVLRHFIQMALENMKAISKANDHSTKDMVKVIVVLTKLANFKLMKEVYKKF